MSCVLWNYSPAKWIPFGGFHLLIKKLKHQQLQLEGSLLTSHGYQLMNCQCDKLFAQARNCSTCTTKLPMPPKPVIQGSATSKVLIIGQAPGKKAHDSCRPWNDPSGDRLRDWLNISVEDFYDASRIALLPMGFCYPGKGKTGDLPPLKECAPKWHSNLITSMQIQITFLIGQYAQNYYLRDKFSLTERVKNWRNYLPQYIVLPHPSPRNNIWLKQNQWFEQQTIPDIKQLIKPFLVS